MTTTNIADIKYGDAIINHLAGCLNPLLIAGHLMNVSAMLMAAQTRLAVANDLTSARKYAQDTARYEQAVSLYRDASMRVNDILENPFELANLNEKYGEKNLPAVREAAEGWQKAALDLVVIVMLVTPIDNPTHGWAINTLAKLKASPGIPSASVPQSNPRARFKVIRGGKE